MKHWLGRIADGRVWTAAVFLFLFLWEWLRPLLALSDTGTIAIFLWFIGTILLIEVIFGARFWTMPLKFLVLFLFIHHFFYPDVPFFDLTWFSQLWADFLDAALSGHVKMIGEISPSVRTGFFMLFLMYLTAFLFRLQLIWPRAAFLILFATVLLITVLDTFTPYKGQAAIVRVVAAGFLYLAFMRLFALQRRMGYLFRWPWRWFAAACVVILIMVAAGWLVPKSSPFWPDPVPWIKSQSLEVIGKTGWGDLPQKVGYDTNDERLGGSFVQDDRIVFTATVNIPTYWRGESKDVYTGTGWKDGEDDKMPITLPFNRDTVPVAGQTVVQQVSYQMPFDFILMGGQLRQLQGIYPDQDALVYLPEKEKIQTDQHTPVKAYSAVTVMPIINEKLLKQSGDDYPQQIRSRYLQLPSDLPARIKEKTLQLTEDETDSYSKVEAVERYLGSSAFHYQTEEIPVPDARRDFVDQFLFETREGYCDYFSTSMAVMLRTIGIPTRWVKGFNMGEVTSFADGGRQEVVVRNRNAHSWVEVYFAGVGWIPFDPTPVFVPPFEVIPDTQSGETAAEGQQQEEKVAQENQLTQKQSVDLSGLKGTLSGIAKWFGWKWANWLILLVILLLLAATWAGAAVVFLPWWSLERRFVFQFKRLLYVTSLRLRVKRHPSQTAREWFAEAGALLGGATRQEWQDLIRQYERIQYANARLNKAEWQEWKRKMRRLALRLRLKSS